MPATLERRCTGYLVDMLLAWVVLLAAVVFAAYRPDVVPGPWLVVGACLAVLLGGGALLVRTGATPGQALVGIRVVDTATGGGPAWWPALARTGLLLLAGPPTLGIGAALLAASVVTDPAGRGRGWHDRVAGTTVIESRAVAAAPPVERSPQPGGPVNLTALRLAAAAPARPPAPVPGGATGRSGGRDVPGRWVLRSGRRRQLLGEPVLLGTARAARIHLATDGMPVVTALGSARGTELVRAGVRRPLRPGAPAALLDGDVVRVADEQVRVEAAGRVSG